jgi:putative SOS response-associated peptidase YedK
MCGRYTLHTEKEALAERFGFDPADLPRLEPHFNIAPTENVVAIVSRDDGRPQARLMRWGLVPPFSNDAKGPPNMINARIETIARQSAFRGPFATQRCLLPADGFFEWQSVRGSKRRIPHLVTRANGAPFAMAGIFAIWRPRGELLAEPLVTCAILTTKSNEALRPLHDRMPVILSREAERGWLDPALDGKVEQLLALLEPTPNDSLSMHPVTQRVNNVKNDDPGLLERDETPPELGFL